MALQKRAAVLLLGFVLVLQGCGTSIIVPDTESTVSAGIVRTLTAQSLAQTATALDIERSTPSPETNAGETPADTAESLVPTVTRAPEVPVTGAPVVTLAQAASCRTGPGPAYDLMGRLEPGSSAPAVGRDASGRYWIVQMPDQEEPCWIFGGYATISGDPSFLPTTEPQPEPEMPVITMSEDTACRSGPGTQYTVLGNLPEGATPDLTGRLASQAWWLARNPDREGENCWLPGESGAVSGNINALPLLEPPEGAQATATATPTPEATGDVSGYSCKIVSRDVKKGADFAPGADFDAVWVVRNTGSAAWDPQAVELALRRGMEMSRDTDEYVLPEAVGPSGEATIRLDMTAPAEPGSYRSVWALTTGGQEFCRLPVVIDVVRR